MYGYQPSTPTADRLLPLVDATSGVTYRLILIADIRDVVNQLLNLCKEKMATRSTRTAPIFQPGDLV